MDDTASLGNNKKSYMEGAFQNRNYRMRIHPFFGDTKNMLEAHKNAASASTLFSRGKRTRSFFTSDSHRYITTLEHKAMLLGTRRYARTGQQFDSALVRYVRPTQGASEVLYQQLQERYSNVLETLRYFPDLLSAHISPARMLNASIIGAVIFGMFSMTIIYRYLGQQVSAESTTTLASAPVVIESHAEGIVLGATDEAASEQIVSQEKVPVSVDPSIALKIAEQARFNAEATDMVKGYPIEVMLPYILKQDRDVASYLIAIGKKESNWGKRVPVLNGHDCYNYWGYRGIRDKMGSGGHTCFNSPEDAVNTVAKRIKTLVQEKKLNTPSKMIVWKCGGSCAGHSGESVRKWISDVDMYIQALK